MAASSELAILVACALLLAAACGGAPDDVPELEIGYYEETCPEAESIVRAAVSEAIAVDAGVGAGLIRLLFHDCFVQGCDASVLLDPTPSNPRPEKLGPPNVHSLRGFEAIDAAKAAVEEACPGTVSCADIVAFAARDASYLLSGYRVDFTMPAGRLDGRRSNASDTVPSLPPGSATYTELVDNFANKGLDAEDMIVLSGAHSVGHARCSTFAADRTAVDGDADIDPSFARSLRRRCVQQAENSTKEEEKDDPTVSQDAVTPTELDSQYYSNVLKRRVLLASDAALLETPEAARMVRDSAGAGGRWERKFGKAMVKMAGIGVKKAGRHAEIRTNCRVVNH
ncbi:peroxidase 2-like [Hordeum vulgare subsp. vulgare]|uniref:peroxidase 2-like n=1 Tax=Hordeum vulgare subsp. vulgare TaxID=112509 RepID=UPI001D1A4A29|nr:peroxidase 2-like [Hordeum vulgare subsp. vulgare]